MSRDRTRTSTSPDGRLVAQWHLDGTMARIHQVHNHAGASTAFSWPSHQQIRSRERGLVVFDAWPDLSTAREAFPGYEAVWDVIRHERLELVFTVADLPTASA
ncbi:hypothetical protein [Nocardia sp. NPDC052112]|uniref:hypothetical protein n=1 Tax=Nocardia sp. NPDC052112 TaxID=3155646 RepID=UPI00342F70CF